MPDPLFSLWQAKAGSLPSPSSAGKTPPRCSILKGGKGVNPCGEGAGRGGRAPEEEEEGEEEGEEGALLPTPTWRHFLDCGKRGNERENDPLAEEKDGGQRTTSSPPSQEAFFLKETHTDRQPSRRTNTHYETDRPCWCFNPLPVHRLLLSKQVCPKML